MSIGVQKDRRPGRTRDGRRVEVAGLTKRFGSVVAVDDLSFVVEPGRVTGFLGPNGAGKTTTLRMLLGLVTPTSGTTTIGGVRYRDLDDPTQAVGASLEATGFHPGRRAVDHLRVVGTPAGVPTSRCEEVLEQVGLADSARRRVGGFSLGMRQRLALAAGLLGDPDVLLLDEPANGLDPEGIRWLRGFLRHLAGQGRTVLVSSHVLSEVQQTVDDVVIIARGRLVRAAALVALERTGTRAVSPSADRLSSALRAEGVAVEPDGAGALVAQADAVRVGRVAFTAGIELHLLGPVGDDLEATFLSLTSGGSGGQAVT